MVCVVAIGAAIPANATVVYSDCVCGSEAWEYWYSYADYESISPDTHLIHYCTSYYCSICNGELIELDDSIEESHSFTRNENETIDGIEYEINCCPCGATLLIPIA